MFNLIAASVFPILSGILKSHTEGMQSAVNCSYEQQYQMPVKRKGVTLVLFTAPYVTSATPRILSSEASALADK